MTVKITDTTMRDGHQSLLATRMRTPPVILSADHILARTAHLREGIWGGASASCHAAAPLAPPVSHFPFPISQPP